MEDIKEKLNKKIAVEDLKEAVICNKEDRVLDVAKILKKFNKRHLYVVDDEKNLLGVISTKDISNNLVAQELDSKTTKAKEIMNKNVIVIDLDKDTYFDVYLIISQKGLLSLPVVKDKKLIGEINLNVVLNKIES